MLNKNSLKESFYFKIGTRNRLDYQLLNKTMSDEWKIKFNRLKTLANYDGQSIEELYEQKAHHYPEFGVISAIAFGLFDGENIDVDVIQNSDEKSLLKEFSNILSKIPQVTLGGYNVVNYDIPYIIKRMTINGIALPFSLQINGKKPWEVNIIDVMREYQGTTYENIELAVVTEVFGIDFDIEADSSKEEYLKSHLRASMELGLRLV